MITERHIERTNTSGNNIGQGAMKGDKENTTRIKEQGQNNKAKITRRKQQCENNKEKTTMVKQ